jgi:hypothetical protein
MTSDQAMQTRVFHASCWPFASFLRARDNQLAFRGKLDIAWLAGPEDPVENDPTRTSGLRL